MDLVVGSISSMAKQEGKSIAETFVSADLIVIVDTSGSMNTQDSANFQSRYDVACKELAALQGSMPGKIAVLAFSDTVIFCPSGIPSNLSGGTDLSGALKFAKVADFPGMRFILISDGEPDDRDAALKIAKSYTNKIDVIYVGPETRPFGKEFLEKLATASGGTLVTSDSAKQLAAGVRLLIGA